MTLMKRAPKALDKVRCCKNTGFFDFCTTSVWCSVVLCQDFGQWFWPVPMIWFWYHHQSKNWGQTTEKVKEHLFIGCGIYAAAAEQDFVVKKAGNSQKPYNVEAMRRFRKAWDEASCCTIGRFIYFSTTCSGAVCDWEKVRDTVRNSLRLSWKYQHY